LDDFKEAAEAALSDIESIDPAEILEQADRISFLILPACVVDFLVRCFDTIRALTPEIFRAKCFSPTSIEETPEFLKAN
jgi:hypothetical protein